MQDIFRTIAKIADYKTTVLITGESGVGKELVARAMHRARSARERGPFVAVNCGAIPENLLESELFGHKKGAFTDANADRRGLFEEADGGTLFLDEIGELPLALQVKLLRVLQEETIRRLGDTKDIKVDVRIIAATHRDLAAEAKAGRFREDLFYASTCCRIVIPPLRARREDITLLIDHFVARNNARLGTQHPRRRHRGAALLLEYAWPGNVRELENTIERAMVLCRRRHHRRARSARAPPRGARSGAGAAGERRALDQEDDARSSRRSSSGARCRRPRATARAPPSCSRSATARCSTRSRTTRSPTCDRGHAATAFSKLLGVPSSNG